MKNYTVLIILVSTFSLLIVANAKPVKLSLEEERLQFSINLISYCEGYNSNSDKNVPIFIEETWKCISSNGKFNKVNKNTLDSICKKVIPYEKKDNDIYYHTDLNRCVSNWLSE